MKISHVLALSSALFSPAVWACACGCGIFDVGTSSMLPTSPGGMAYVEYDFMDQNQNRNASTSAPASDNGDKEIRTHFLTLGGQYVFNRSWGVQVDLPYDFRYFNTTDTAGNRAQYNHGAMGDIRLRGIYTGSSEDMATGLMFGLRLPTGDWKYPGFDRDTEIGSGSTDLLLGAYHFGNLSSDGAWGWFGQISLDQPVLTEGGYLPGNEIDTALGAYYDRWMLGQQSTNKIVPMLQALASVRGADSGYQADPINSGYERLFLAPGLEADVGNIKFYAGIEVPYFQHFNGDQLTAPILYKTVLSYGF